MKWFPPKGQTWSTTPALFGFVSGVYTAMLFGDIKSGEVVLYALCAGVWFIAATFAGHSRYLDGSIEEKQAHIEFLKGLQRRMGGGA